MYIADVYIYLYLTLDWSILGLASDYFNVLNYITYGEESMKYHCSFRILTPLSALVFKMHYHV